MRPHWRLQKRRRPADEALPSGERAENPQNWAGAAVADFVYRNLATPHPAAVKMATQTQRISLPYTVGKWLLIMKKISGMDMYVLCFERSPASGTAPSGGGVPAFVAAMILRWFGQIRIHTFAAMIVPKIEPMWMKSARPDISVPRPNAVAVISTKEMPAPTGSFLASCFQRRS